MMISRGQKDWTNCCAERVLLCKNKMRNGTRNVYAELTTALYELYRGYKRLKISNANSHYLLR